MCYKLSRFIEVSYLNSLESLRNRGRFAGLGGADRFDQI